MFVWGKKMVKKDEAQAISYKESKKVAKFYKKLDKAIKRAARNGYTCVRVSGCGFSEDDLLYLLRPYYKDEGYDLIRRSTNDYNDSFEKVNCFTGFSLEWTKPPIKTDWIDYRNNCGE